MSGSNGKPTRLPWLTRSAYSVGHVLNDLTAAVWFSYLVRKRWRACEGGLGGRRLPCDLQD